ncbi:hydroxymethylglutaryl-CoA synthase, partial [Conexibacter sp. JD483]|uniref:Zn-ribbon domain-containing OB-fold protein n=2 Tax=Conexibacter TaxID=191494 RepID=UPI0028707E57
LALALRGGGAVVAADLRTAAPGVPDELAHGDAAVAFVPARAGRPVVASVLAHVAATEELMERWRAPGEAHPTVWDERFSAGVLGAAASAAAVAALERAGIERPDHVVVACANPRAAAAARKALGGDGEDAALERLTGTSGAAHLGLLLADALDRAGAGETILALSAADGADAFVVRADVPAGAGRRGPSAREQAQALAYVTYDRFLRWRGLLEISGAKRPDPAPPAAPPALRTRDWKFGLVAARCSACGAVTTPPGRACAACGAIDAHEPVSLRDKPARVVSFTVDHLTPTPAPPLILAIVDVEGGGRRSVQVTDAPAAGIRVGDVLLPSFRRLSSTDGIHNYFWKARPEAA